MKEAFAPELIARAVRDTPGTVSHIVDPFGGSGTTALAAQFLGIRPTTIEVNPFLADLIEAKVGTIDFRRAASELRNVIEAVALKDSQSVAPTFPGAPATFVEPGKNGRWLFSREVARRIISIRSAIEAVPDPGCRRLFRVALGAAAIPVSNVTVSGKGRRYRSGWERNLISPDRVDQLFIENVSTALYDLRRFMARRCRDYVVLRGDARELVPSVGQHDLAVFSPPYPNSFDYTDVYNVELWTLGYLTGPKSNATLRKSTIRSHVQIFRDMTHGRISSRLLDQTLLSLREARSQLWNRHIPEMIGAYMADMIKVLDDLALGLRSQGRVYMVVGDSRYAGIEVNVAEILAEAAHSLSYRVARIEPCRSMRVSPQQGGRHELAETLLVLERP